VKKRNPAVAFPNNQFGCKGRRILVVALIKSKSKIRITKLRPVRLKKLTQLGNLTFAKAEIP
jgi:hypothetical protein